MKENRFDWHIYVARPDNVNVILPILTTNPYTYTTLKLKFDFILSIDFVEYETIFNENGISQCVSIFFVVVIFIFFSVLIKL